MLQIGIDISNLPEVNGFRYIEVCIDYFTKWSEVKPLKDNSKYAWVILTEGELSWYTIDRIYWKSSINKAIQVVGDEKEYWMSELDDFWMKNYLYKLKIEDKRILQSTDG